MAVFVLDTFTEAVDTTLASHTGETGATWTKHASSGAGTLEVVASIDEIRPNGAGSSKYYYSSGVPDSADYTVTAVFERVNDESENHTMGVTARNDTAANTRYYLIVETFTAGVGTYELGKTVAGASTTLDTWTQTDPSVTQTNVVEWSIVGDDHSVVIDAVERLTATDSAIASAGRVGAQAFGNALASDGWHVSSLLGETADTGRVPREPARDFNL